MHARVYLPAEGQPADYSDGRTFLFEEGGRPAGDSCVPMPGHNDLDRHHKHCQQQHEHFDGGGKFEY
ncbi:MAG: hypothetical protein D6815_11785 [Candidatus Dadabacteria bacterium]|nr:MAG: hypothetical protein D6815_11785 [Candidatus Dadabacteria bacterium]